MFLDILLDTDVKRDSGNHTQTTEFETTTTDTDSDDEFEQMRYVMDGLRTPNEAFFHLNSKLLDLGRQIGQIKFGTCWVFSAELSAPILVL